MSGTPPQLPSMAVIARALRSTTERLAREVVQPSEAAPDWNELEWGVARATCALHGIATLLAHRLRWTGPRSWAGFLAEQRDHSRAHYDVAGGILAGLDSAARDAGVACVALKGAAIRELGLYQPGERPMGDIDLLVSERDLAACKTMLAHIGYEPAYSMRRHDVFAPVVRQEAHAFAEHAGNPLKIELHTHISECLPASAVDITAGLWPARVHAGLNGYASRAALLRHLLLHTAGNMRAHVLRFMQLHDIAQLGRRLDSAEWRGLLESPDSRETGWWVYPPLALAEKYLPGSIPPPVLTAFRAMCPARLRARAGRYDLYEVSWSNLRIAALPGAEWARSPLELLRFARTRLLPGRAALRELGLASRAHPSVRQVRWYDASHGERILRWVFTRPPRVQTLVSVRAALASARADP